MLKYFDFAPKVYLRWLPPRAPPLLIASAAAAAAFRGDFRCPAAAALFLDSHAFAAGFRRGG
jgi:hypothetical protein